MFDAHNKHYAFHNGENRRNLLSKELFGLPLQGDIQNFFWVTAHKNKGENAFRGSGNYSSDEAKEIARLKRELRDTQDALEVLKKAIGILGK